MEKALTKVGSLKAGTFWVSQKAKEEISNISQDLSSLVALDKTGSEIGDLLEQIYMLCLVCSSKVSAAQKAVGDCISCITQTGSGIRDLLEHILVLCSKVMAARKAEGAVELVIFWNIVLRSKVLAARKVEGDCISCSRQKQAVELTVSNTIEEKAKWIFNKLKGKPTKSLADLMREHNLPSGLFPQNITCYEFDETKNKLVVYLPSTCEVSFKDSSVVRYATRVKATLSRGKITGIEGMKTKVLMWVKVTSVTVEGSKSDKVWFTAGVKKARSKDAYEISQNAIRVGEF